MPCDENRETELFVNKNYIVNLIVSKHSLGDYREQL